MNHIETIEIKNFKSIKHAEIKDCRRVNVFIGYPNVGKSNILEALGLFSLTRFMNEFENSRLDSICRLNRFSDLHFDKNLKNEVHVVLNSKYDLSFIVDENSGDLDLRVNRKDKFDLISKGIMGENYKWRITQHIDEAFSKRRIK